MTDESINQSIVDMMKNPPSSNATTSIQDAPPTVTTTKETAAPADGKSDKIVLPSMPSALVGSIVGTRSESGTMVELKGTGSFDVIALSTTMEDGQHNSFGRLRAQTAPSILSPSSPTATPITTVAATNTTDTTGSSTANLDASTGSAVTGGDGGINTNTSLNQTASYVVEEDDDEEIRIAMAMALAIQSNPHLTPNEIHELLGTTPQQQKQQFQTLSSVGTKPTKATSAAVATSTAASLLSSFTTSSTATTSTKPSRFTQMFSSFATATSATTPTSTSSNNPTANDSTTTTSSNVTTGTTTTASTAVNVAPTLSPVEEKSSTESTAAATVANTKPLPVVTPSATTTVSSTEQIPVTVSSKMPRDLTVSTTSSSLNYNDALLPPTMVEPSKVVTSPSTTSNTMNVMRTESSTGSTITHTTPSNAAAALHHPTLSPSFTKQISQRSAMLFKSASAKNNSSGGSVGAAHGGGGGGTNLSTPKVQSPTVRISGIAWKRRGGMGKYSASNAWERRRIELVGTKLLYYIIDENDDSQFHPTSDDTSHHSRSVVDHQGMDTPTTSNGGNVTSSRRGNWLENTGMNFTASITSSTGVTEGMNKEPRGFIDLAKEKATVHAAFGHSGAPTPFALSIKVRSETKWKLCFDRHSIEMDWLAAISDVVIQCSVDAYNGYLLEAADPANHSDFTLFHPPTIKDGPVVTKSVASTVPTTTTAIMGSSTQHRLWMLEDYKVSNVSENADAVNDEGFPALPFMDDKGKERDHSSRMDDDSVFVTESSNSREDIISKDLNNTEVTSTQVYETTTAIDHDMIQDTILNESNQHWILPQEKLPFVLLIVNIALFYTRASSTSISGFWSMVVCTNFGILMCFGKEPTWQSVVDLINSAPTTTSRKSTVNAATVTNRSAPIAVSAIQNVAAVDNSKKASLVDPISDSSVSKISEYIPAAGCTSVHLKNPSDIPQNAKGEMFAGWCNVPGEILAIRSHGYAVTKKKVPSPGELYECIHLEVFESPQRYPDMAKRVKLPKVEFDDDVRLKTWRCPDLFIISIALPTDPPRMGKTSSDGGGYTITMYYRMKQETREILRRVTADGYDPSSEVISEDEIQTSKVNAVRLLEEWIRRAPTDHKFQSRFKIVPNAHNLKEIGMPAWISKYNGKPFLIKRPGVTGFLFAHPELSCVEFDVSLHPFPYLAKQAICFMKESYFKKVLVSFGFVIEGRADDELPECLIGLVQLCYPDPQYAIQAADFFNGTAQRSF